MTYHWHGWAERAASSTSTPSRKPSGSIHGTATITLAVLSLVCSFDIRRRRMLLNPVLVVEHLSVQPRRPVWSYDDQRSLLAVADQTMQMDLLLGLYTAHRHGDLLRLQCSQYDGRRISLTQGKTAQAVSILVMNPLRMPWMPIPAWVNTSS